MPTPTRQLVVRTPVPLIERAQAVAPAGLTPSELVRYALANLAGADVAEYPVHRGSAPGENRGGGRRKRELIPTP